MSYQQPTWAAWQWPRAAQSYQSAQFPATSYQGQATGQQQTGWEYAGGAAAGQTTTGVQSLQGGQAQPTASAVQTPTTATTSQSTQPQQPTMQPAAAQSAGVQAGAAGEMQGAAAQTTGVQAGAEAGMAAPAGVPSVDVLETTDEVLVYVDMPGFEEDHITIQADEQTLVVTGERPDDYDPDDYTVHLRERPMRVQRSVYLPGTADVEDATAEHDNGVCEITLPKSEEGRGRTIAFQ